MKRRNVTEKKVHLDFFSILECHLFLPNLVTRFCPGTDYHLKQEQEISWLHLIGFVLINTRKLRLPNKDLIVKKEQENIIFAPCQHVSPSQIYNAQVPTTLSIERIQSTNKSLLNAPITSQWHNNQLHKVNLNHGGPKSLFSSFFGVFYIFQAQEWWIWWIRTRRLFWWSNAVPSLIINKTQPESFPDFFNINLGGKTYKSIATDVVLLRWPNSSIHKWFPPLPKMRMLFKSSNGFLFNKSLFVFLCGHFEDDFFLQFKSEKKHSHCATNPIMKIPCLFWTQGTSQQSGRHLCPQMIIQQKNI